MTTKRQLEQLRRQMRKIRKTAATRRDTTFRGTEEEFRRAIDAHYLRSRADVLEVNPAYRAVADRCRALDICVPTFEMLQLRGVDLANLALNIAHVTGAAEAARLIREAPRRAN